MGTTDLSAKFSILLPILWRYHPRLFCDVVTYTQTDFIWTVNIKQTKNNDSNTSVEHSATTIKYWIFTKNSGGSREQHRKGSKQPLFLESIDSVQGNTGIEYLASISTMQPLPSKFQRYGQIETFTASYKLK